VADAPNERYVAVLAVDWEGRIVQPSDQPVRRPPNAVIERGRLARTNLIDGLADPWSILVNDQRNPLVEISFRMQG
jgi:hypothetical protein